MSKINDWIIKMTEKVMNDPKMKELVEKKKKELEAKPKR